MPLPFKQVDEYHLQRIIQEGPYTISVKAWQPTLQRPVFMKLLKPHLGRQEEWGRRFRREARVSARLKHPQIVDVYTIGEFEGYTYMAMQYVEGLSLKDLLEKEGSLLPAAALEITRQLLLALKFAHRRQIIHRDVKPGNILTDIEGHVRLTDFGLAHLGEDAAMTQQGSILGTPAYMAPEQITGEPLSPATDFFAAGATLYEMLTGTKPFGGENYSVCIQKILNENPPPVSELDPRIDSRIAGFVDRLLEKNPSGRPQNADEILPELEQLPGFTAPAKTEPPLGGLVSRHIVRDPGEADASHRPGPSATETVSGTSSPKKIRVISLLAIFVLLLLTGLYFWWPQTPDRAQPGSTTPTEKDLPAKISGTASPPWPDSTATAAGIPEQKAAAATLRKEEPAADRKVQTDSLAADQKSGKKQALSETPPSQKTAGEQTAIHTPIFDKQQQASIMLEIEPFADVTVDGREIDSTLRRRRIRLSPGIHRMTFSHPEFAPKFMEIKLAPGEDRTIQYSFLEDAAFLMVAVRPWANVYIDGKLVDVTPLERAIVLAPGEHRLELRHPDYSTFRQIIRIEAGDTMTVKKNLMNGNGT